MVHHHMQTLSGQHHFAYGMPQYRVMQQNTTYVVYEMPKDKYTMQNDCLLGNNDTDFLDDRKLVLLAIELGVTSRKDLPDLSVMIKDLV